MNFSRSIKSIFTYTMSFHAFELLSPPFINYKVLDEKLLPLAGWPFYKITSKRIFWLTYFYQALFLGLNFTYTIATDILFSGLLIHTCAQAALIKHRLINLPKLTKEKQYKLFATIIRQHIAVYRYEKKFEYAKK